MDIAEHPAEQQITLDDTKDSIVVEQNDVAAGDTQTPAYVLEGPQDTLVGIMRKTPVAPEFRDASGNKIDGATRVEIVKCDKQGNRLGDGVAFSETLGKFNYEKFRNDPDFFRYTTQDLMLNEREIIKIFLDIPQGANGYSAADSRITVGDDTSDFGKAVEVIDHDDLSQQELRAIKSASTAGGN